MIIVTDLEKSYGVQTLFAGVSLQLDRGARYGVVGANGSGKSTFLRILAGEVPPSGGSVTIPRRATLGVLEQDHFAYENEPILDVVMMGKPELWEAMKVKERTLAAAAEHFDAEAFGEAEETVQRLDGYAFESRAAEILEGLGIPDEVHRRPLSTLSGGFRLRVLLAKTLAAGPDVLLLDEPTNHLDIVSIRWLETFLSEFGGCVVVISHDHRFLDNVATRILDVDYETITEYPGDYAAFERAKADERERRETEIARRKKEIEHHMKFVERFRAKATKARQAQSKLKQVERIELEPLPESSRRYPTFRFDARRPSGKVVLEVEDLAKSYGEKRVLENVSLTVRRGERIAVIGPNGVGKSTLLKIAVGRLDPDRGEIAWGYETHPGYFAQDHREQVRSPAGRSMTAEEWLWEAIPGAGIGTVRGQLGLVLFSGDEALKPLDALSGGEAARLLFARLAALEPNVLVLDEPTNHLDLEAIEALVEGLEAYDGTILFVSHDRWFVERIAGRIVEIGWEGIRDFHGGFADYVRHSGDDHLDAAEGRIAVRRGTGKNGGSGDGSGDGSSRRTGRGGTTSAAGRLDPARRRELAADRDRLLERIERAEARLAELHAKCADPATWSAADPEEVRRLERDEREAAGDVETLVAEWEALERRLEEEGAP